MTEDYSSLLGEYITQRFSTEKPPSEEREVLRSVPFASLEFKYRGRAMELPHLSFLGINADAQGKFVLVTWGYSDGHHIVSSPVTFKDRRNSVVELVSAHQQSLKEIEQSRLVSVLEAELQEVTTKITELTMMLTGEEKDGLNEEYLRKQIANLQGQLATESQQDSQESRDKLAVNQAQLRIFESQLLLSSPETIALQIKQLRRNQERIESLLSVQQNRTYSQSEALVQADVRKVFSESGGVLAEVKVLNSVSGAPVTELEIADLDPGMTPSGKFSLVAQGMHIPKPLSVLFAGFTSVAENSSEITPGSQEVIEQQVITEIYRSISFSSGTGRHSGWGHISATTK